MITQSTNADAKTAPPMNYHSKWKCTMLHITHRLKEIQPRSGSRIAGTIGQGPAKLLL